MSNLSDFFATAAVAPAPQSGNTPHSQLAFTMVGGATNDHYYDHWRHDQTNAFRQTVWTNISNSRSRNSSGYTYNYTTQPANSPTYATRGGHGITMNGWLGHQLYNFGETTSTMTKTSGCPPLIHNYTLSLAAMRASGTVIGLDQDYALITSTYTAGNGVKLSITPRSMEAAIRSKATGTKGGTQYNSTNAACKLATVGALTTGYALMTGGVSHNQSTGNMVIIERDNSAVQNPWRPILLKNVPDPRKYVNRDDEFADALTTAMGTASNRVVGAFSTSGVTTRGGTDFGDWHGKVVLCNNNDVVLYLQTNNGAQIHRWRWNESSGAFAAVEYHQPTLNGTANYGVSPPVSWQMTLDGKESVLCSYHNLYHAGLRAIFLDNTNGNISYTAYSYSTANAFSIAPLGASQFIITSSQNTGSAGPYAQIVNKRILEKAQLGSSASVTTDSLASATQINIDQSGDQLMDVGYPSTSYPTMVVNVSVDNKAIVAAESGE